MFNFVSRVKIIAKIINCANSEVYFRKSERIHYIDFNRCDADEITIEREWDSWNLKDDHLKIGKSIMDEIANCYGFWNSRFLTYIDESIQLTI